MVLTTSDVSRETIERLEIYQELVKKWNPTINLVAKSTIVDLWSRHIEDSLQIGGVLLKKPNKWMDLGSGGGFPGIVIAIAAIEISPDTQFYLVESDKRKCAFLRSVTRETGINCEIISERIENLEPVGADVISARALAPLSELLSYAALHQVTDGLAIFMKGKAFAGEIEEAQNNWKFNVVAQESLTDKEARILHIRGLTRAN